MKKLFENITMFLRRNLWIHRIVQDCCNGLEFIIKWILLMFLLIGIAVSIAEEGSGTIEALPKNLMEWESFVGMAGAVLFVIESIMVIVMTIGGDPGVIAFRKVLVWTITIILGKRLALHGVLYPDEFFLEPSPVLILFLILYGTSYLLRRASAKTTILIEKPDQGKLANSIDNSCYR